MLYEKITNIDFDEIREMQPPDWGDIIPDIEFYINSSFFEPIKATIDNISNKNNIMSYLFDDVTK